MSLFFILISTLLNLNLAVCYFCGNLLSCSQIYTCSKYLLVVRFTLFCFALLAIINVLFSELKKCYKNHLYFLYITFYFSVFGLVIAFPSFLKTKFTLLSVKLRFDIISVNCIKYFNLEVPLYLFFHYTDS